MIRMLFMIFGVCCATIVVGEAAALGWLWSQGRLTHESLRDVRDVLSGTVPETKQAAAVEEKPAVVVDEVLERRVGRLFDLTRREEELSTLKSLAAEQAKRVTAMQSQLETKQRDFEKRLKDLRAANDEASIQQSRSVLAALQPAEAADALMGLPPEQSLTVLRGMPEKSIARILKEMSRNADKAMRERGQKLFESLTSGEPERSLLQSAEADASPKSTQ